MTERPRKKRTPRQAWRDEQRAEKRAIAQAVRDASRFLEALGPVPPTHTVQIVVPVRVPIRRGDN